MKYLALAVAALAAALTMTTPPAFAHLGGRLVDEVKAINARFADVNTALKEGYAPIPCVSGIEGGAMGVHYVNGAYLNDDAVDIGKPEAVMYEPQADGSMQLVAVEYITHKGPASLGGQLFSFTNSPNRYGLDPFYELHVWAWRDNPTGSYADMNPTVSCEAVAEQKPAAALRHVNPYGPGYLPEPATKVAALRTVNPYGPGFLPVPAATVRVASLSN